MMTKLRLLGAIASLLVTAALAPSQDRAATQDTRDRFVGAWRLLWLEEPDANGNVRKADCTGLLVYTRDGHMSVQVMYRNPPPENKSALPQYALGGYEASFGRYEIDDAHSFTFHVEGALVRTLIDKDLKRVYKLSGNQLIVSSPNPNEQWKVLWERD
jgi:Lipocalin-like domain